MRWTLKSKPEKEKVQKLQNELQVDALIATLLVQRGVETYNQAKAFFRPSLTDLHDPFLMKDMDKAVVRIEEAILKGENILVFGDYDVDGTTAVSLVSSYLKSYYPNVATYIPDRYDEGYGISYNGIDFAEDNEFTLIIALDCGIKSIDHIAYANAKNIDFIICDHHRPGDELPKAVAILDPKRNDCSYPYDELCGCGIGFKLIQALASKRGQTLEDLVLYLDLVATAIAADIVPITGENRILAKYGLEVINSNPRPGIKALIQNVNKKSLTITDVVFIVAPRINAAGRIKHGNEAVALLTEYDLDQAEQFASEIEQHNSDRKGLDKQITVEALAQIEDNNEKENFTTVIYQENWHKGVIGIVASRLTETYYRPTIVFTKSGDKLAASARSVKDFDVYNAIEACSMHLEQFGGHTHAAGLTLNLENVAEFQDTFEQYVQKNLTIEDRLPTQSIDLEISLAELFTAHENRMKIPRLKRILEQFEPFGPGNMKPVFLATNCYATDVKILGESHLKLVITQPNTDIQIPAIGFNLANKEELTAKGLAFDVAFTLETNTWKNKSTIQLNIKDLREHC
jgi:single-stranded-DNA-specific exonuclease